MSKDKGKNIIIVRRAGRHEEEDHGGSWKVAYADFVTALMAFFLLLWLVSMTKPETKTAVAQYFREYNLFTSQPARSTPGVTSVGAGPVDSAPRMSPGHEMRWSADEVFSARELKPRLDQSLRAELGQDSDRLLLEEYQDGLRIHLVDKQGQPSFRSGDPALTRDGLQALRAVERAIRFVPNKIAIEGHTDAHIPSGGLDNWRLAIARAEQVRHHLGEWGFDLQRLVHVAGYASTAPLIVGDPHDPRNRRVSILLYDSKAAMPVSTIGIGEGRIITQPAGAPPQGE